MTTTGDGAVALVVGASSGIGAAVAAALDQAGLRIALNSARQADAGKALAAGLTDALYVQEEMGTQQAALRLVDRVVDHFGRLDVVVYAAGRTRWVPYADVAGVTAEDWQGILDVNLLGPWWVSAAAEPALRESPAGNIVFVGSLAGTQAGGSSVPYAVSKAALHHMGRTLAVAMGPSIRVNVVAPGFIDTPWTAQAQQLRAAMSDKAPLGRAGRPDEVAEVVLGFIRSTYVTGQVVVADGGFGLVP